MSKLNIFLTFKAESWLNSQAQSQGWAKAAKLQNRSTPNGLIGLAFNNKSAVMVVKKILHHLVPYIYLLMLIFLGGS